MYLVPLSQDRFALIDDEDADLLEHRWYAAKRGRSFYASRNVGPATIDLHLVIGVRMGIAGIEVDHRNCHGLDCRRGNLRAATNSQNQANRTLQKNNRSGFKGVCWCNRTGKWLAQLRLYGRTKFLGYFADKTEAAKAYDRAAVATFGEFARTNFK